MHEALIGWGTFKARMGRGLEVSQAMLHIHLGLALFLIAARVLGGKPGRMAPLLLVAALEVANEVLDYVRYSVSGWPWTPWGTIGDLINTLLWPVVLTVIFRHRERARIQAAGEDKDPALPVEEDGLIPECR